MANFASALTTAASGFLQEALATLGTPGALRRPDDDPVAPGDRPCTVVLQAFTAEEKAGKLYDPADLRFVVESGGITIPPSRDDTLVVYMSDTPTSVPRERVFSLIAPTGILAGAGVIIGWQLQVREVT